MHVEIVLPETQPESEWIRGRAVRKVSPTRRHGRVQAECAALLLAWSRGRGEVATEWRFRLEPPGEARRPLVPDIAFVANAALAGRSEAELEAPTFAPTVAIEVLSPGDAPADVASKTSVYLRCGTNLVVVLDPQHRTAILHDATVREVRLSGDGVLKHAALPGFTLRLDRFFALALDSRPR